MPFRNRSEAGRSLAVALARYKEEEPAILALPRGGVAVAAEVAAALDAPLDLILPTAARVSGLKDKQAHRKCLATSH